MPVTCLLTIKLYSCMYIFQARAGPNTEFTDLQGRFVVPGFIDSHLHLISGGLQACQWFNVFLLILINIFLYVGGFKYTMAIHL